MKTSFLFLLMTRVLLPISANAADAGGSAPATITKESDLVILTLTPAAEAHLRLKVVAVEKRTVPSVRLFPGEVVTPLSSGEGTIAPVIGGTLDELLRLADLQATADGRILQAQVQVDAAKIQLERAKKMFGAEVGSERGVDEATTSLALAEATMTTARAQRDLLGATMNQAGAKEERWVRVAIYSGESPKLDKKAEARISPLGDSATVYTVKPVEGPSTANTLNSTLDCYYEMPEKGQLRPGERVSVEIPTLEGQLERLVIPFNAVLHDIQGGQWVYEQRTPHTYTRRRIQVERLAGTDAVLASGPPAGTLIVTDGSAELFGTEFMTGK
jgi:membrane fusion protein, multidrug efflux system